VEKTIEPDTVISTDYPTVSPTVDNGAVSDGLPDYAFFLIAIAAVGVIVLIVWLILTFIPISDTGGKRKTD
jgi:hypothetical protein